MKTSEQVLDQAPPESEVPDPKTITADLSEYITIQHLESDQQQSIIELAQLALTDPHRFYDLISSSTPGSTPSAHLSDAAIRQQLKFHAAGLNSLLADIAGDGGVFATTRGFNQQLQEARRVFSASLIQAVNTASWAEDDQTARQVADHIYQSFYDSFGGGWNMSELVGGTKSQMELLSLARAARIPTGISQDIVGTISYDTSFTGDNNPFLDILSQSQSPIQKVHQIEALYIISRAGDGQGFTDNSLRFAHQELAKIADNPQESQLVRIAARTAQAKLAYFAEANFQDLAELPPDEQASLYEKDAAYRQQQLQEQASLRQRFPYFNDNITTVNTPNYRFQKYTEPLAQVADDAVLNLKTDVITDRQGRQTSLLGQNFLNQLELSREQIGLLHILHQAFDGDIERQISQTLGFNTTDLPLATQLKLLAFMTNTANGEKFDRVAATFANIPTDQRPAFADTFLALEFGDDFGDRLLDIAEQRPSAESQMIFSLINRIRQSAKVLSAEFAPQGEAFQAAYETSWIKRITEMLVLISSPDTSPADKQAALQVLQIVEYGVSAVATSINQDFSVEPHPLQGYATLRYAGGQLVRTIRGKGDQLRVGNTVKVPLQLTPAGYTDDRRLSIRLDYDQYGLSLDIGSLSQDPKKRQQVGFFVAEQLAKGEALLAQERGQSAQLNGYHIREVFQPLQMTRQQFAEIIERIIDPETYTVPEFSQIAQKAPRIVAAT